MLKWLGFSARPQLDGNVKLIDWIIRLPVSSPEPNDYRKDLRRYGGLGIDLFANTIVGLVIGYLLDLWLGTTPWLMIAGLLFGSAAGFMAIFRTIREAERKDAER